MVITGHRCPVSHCRTHHHRTYFFWVPIAVGVRTTVVVRVWNGIAKTHPLSFVVHNSFISIVSDSLIWRSYYRLARIQLFYFPTHMLCKLTRSSYVPDRSKRSREYCFRDNCCWWFDIISFSATHTNKEWRIHIKLIICIKIEIPSVSMMQLAVYLTIIITYMY